MNIQEKNFKIDMHWTQIINNSRIPVGENYHRSRILGRLWSLAYSHIRMYAPFSEEPNSRQGCGPYNPEILRNKLLRGCLKTIVN